MKPSFCPFLFHVPDNSETINRNRWNLLRFMSFNLAWGPSWTAYFRLEAAGLPLPEAFVLPEARLVFEKLQRKAAKAAQGFDYPVT